MMGNGQAAVRKALADLLPLRHCAGDGIWDAPLVAPDTLC